MQIRLIGLEQLGFKIAPAILKVQRFLNAI